MGKHSSSSTVSHNHYTLDLWRHQMWVRENRYYRCDIQQDLFGKWLCVRSWGGIKSGRGNQKTTLCPTYLDALRVMKTTEKRRKQRGYHAATPSVSADSGKTIQ